ncbi:MAG TPA: hypothetical protein VF407_08875 [Polyangiaceae bacterium]
MKKAARRAALWLAPIAVAACGGSNGSLAGDPNASLRTTALLAKDPIVRPARLVPEVPNDDHRYGVEPGGGVRTLASGMRLVNLPNGAVMSADTSLPSTPARVVELPDRMGGGFLFLLSPVVWHADRWLGKAKPLYRSNDSLDDVVVGLDRVYLHSIKGAEEAIDPRTGKVLDLGAWPPAPYVGSYAAMDGWRAVATTDLRGIVGTFDAGASWHPLPIALNGAKVRASNNGIVVTGWDNNRADVAYEVRPDGQVAKLGAASVTPPEKPSTDRDDVAKPFGDRPLVAALEDGWPLADGTVVVARDGALARIRLDDGTIVESASNAYALRPSRCHAIPYGDGAAFVCGEPRGKTAIYKYSAGAMIEAHHFDSPRLVLASGAGAVVVRGGCSPSASGDSPDPNARDYCVVSKAAAASTDDSGARDVRLRGDVDGERVVALSNGKLAVVSPPHGDLATARITVVDESGAATTKPIRFAPGTPIDATKLAKNGLWLDGIEEKRPGVLGAWSSSNGTMLGMEIELDGAATAGEVHTNLGTAMVSGRFGLGWSATRKGWETIDGGMTWKPFDVPDSLRSSSSVGSSQSCGPIGCVVSFRDGVRMGEGPNGGWLRIGWGAKPPKQLPEPVQGPRTHYAQLPPIALACEPTRPAPVVPPTLATPTKGPLVKEVPTLSPIQPYPIGGGLGNRPPAPYPGWQSGYRAPPIMTTFDWTPFFSTQAPSLRGDEVGYGLDAPDFVDRSMKLGALMHFYAWGSRGTEWEHTSHWIVRWLAPFAGPTEMHSTQIAVPPSVVIDSSHFASQFGAPHPVGSWMMVPGDDALHALLVAKRQQPQDTIVLALEADHPPIEIKRADGEPFGELDAAIRMRGRWFFAEESDTASASTIWEADGTTAHELATLPRIASARSASEDDREQPLRLVARSDARAIGVVVDGQPLADQPNTPVRWVLSIDVEDATLGALEPLGATDFTDRKTVTTCSGDEAGWVMDTEWKANRIDVAVKGATRQLRTPYVRLRVTPSTLCIEKLAGFYDAPPELLTRRGNLTQPVTSALETIAVSSHIRYPLRCMVTP